MLCNEFNSAVARQGVDVEPNSTAAAVPACTCNIRGLIAIPTLSALGVQFAAKKKNVVSLGTQKMSNKPLGEEDGE